MTKGAGMAFKDGTRLFGLKAELIPAMVVAEGLCHEYGVQPVVTSIADGTHKPFSSHVRGMAFDLRVRDIPETKREGFRRKLESRLTSEFQVILEPTHIHIQFKPKD